MAELMHLLMAKFKEDAVVEDILKRMEKVVSETGYVKSFQWGNDVDNPEIVRKGFTHAFLMTFNNKEELNAFVAHPKHVEFTEKFATEVDKGLVFDFPVVTVKVPECTTKKN